MVGFWEARSADIVDAYDHPESWPARGWPDDRLERELVPGLLEQQAVTSVLVVGCGSGRQYRLLEHLRIELAGFDVSPSLVAVCRQRFPGIRSEVDDVTYPSFAWRADAVCCTHVLQHIAPDLVEAAVRQIAAFARRLIILREMAWLAPDSDYQWGRDYRPMLPDWRTVASVVTDASDVHRTELIALAPS